MTTLTAPPVTYLATARRRPVGPFRRVLVTGSRTWTHTPTIRYALATVWAPGVVLVTGECDQGADLLADQCWTRWGGHVEHWPADWPGPCGPHCLPGHRVWRRGRLICPYAGLARNTAMVTAGNLDIVVAFIHRASHGATHCMTTAVGAGVPATVYRARHQPPEWAALVA